jgi:plastocyanin
MPNSLRKGAIAFVAFTAALNAGPAVAQSFLQSQNVLILDEAFFPDVIYVKPGDELVFINHAAATRTVTGADAVWTSGELSKGDTFFYVVDESSPLEFTSIFEGEEGQIYQGTLSFDDPPSNTDMGDDDTLGEAISSE